MPLAKDKVRHVGEPLAIVIAESRYIAEDALDDIDVELEQLPAVVDLEKALAGGSALVHDDVGSNVSAHVRQTKGNYAAAAAAADHIIRRRFLYEHGISSPIETRGVVAQWDARANQMTIWDTTQAPVFVRNGLAGMLGLNERQVRVIAPFVGGGFGPKIMMFYPEEVLLPWVSMQLNRPIKWIEDRLEHFFATTHERGQIHDAEIALTNDGRILGIKDVFLHDGGAYDPYGLTVPINSQCTLLGPYVVPNYDSTFTQVFTNLPIVTPYRGAGRQHGVFVMERLLDFAAHELNIDPRRDQAAQSRFHPMRSPTTMKSSIRTFEVLEYDSGNYEPVLDMALEAIGYGTFKDEQTKTARRRPPCRHRRSPAMSRAPESAPMKAPRFRCSPTARSASPPGSAPRDRDTSRCSRRSPPISSASTSRMSTSSPAIPISSIGAPAPLPAAAPWWQAMPSTKRQRRCGRRR